MPQHERKHHRRRRRFRFTKLYGLISVLIIVAAMIGGSIVFFRVNEVTVEGNQRYTEQEILDVANIEYGKNMFFFNKFEVVDGLLSSLTYVDTVTVRRNLPDTIEITVTECGVAAAVEDAQRDAWWLINDQGKLLERVDSPGEDPQVVGLTVVDPTPGEMLEVDSEQRLQMDALLAILPSLESRGLDGDTQEIDLSSTSTVTLRYANRLSVKMSLSSDFDYNLRVVATVMEEYVEPTWEAGDTGMLDLTNEDGQPHLIKDAS